MRRGEVWWVNPDFQFSQASLQDYVDCPRRFQLRHLLQLAWPAVEAEPAGEFEAHIAQGQAFHRLIHQHLLGLPAERLSRMVTASAADAEGSGEAGRLSAWWADYLRAGPVDLPPARHPEITLSAAVSGHRLLAKYDLIAVEPGGRAAVVDWKTSRNRPKRAWLSARLQTRVYRYLLVRAGAHLNGGGPIDPEAVTMIYWFANHPDDPETFPYDATQYRADGEYLAALIAEIASLADDFPLTGDARRCRFCPYRSLCDRGIEAGALAPEEGADDAVGWAEPEAEAALDTTFDFEQIAEIAF
ncbi:MAG: PD-(D/E)XK nuclease family protein [Chloroflexi bacterium HGW-Chloroflexi-1]|nr:MAG: PD-(D/E)XK nuclease family protein [Chloroflexi bacterium HGW-Chloroflexi-1]